MEATAYAQGMTRRDMRNFRRKLAIKNAVCGVEETKPALKREVAGLDMAALERFRKAPVKKGLRFGSVTTSEDGGFSDDEGDE